MDERDWSGLPEELLRSIGESIQARIDVVRFRSVCASWRSSIPPPCDILPSIPHPLPYPTRSNGRAFVSHRTFYRLKLADDVNPNPSTCLSKSWLVKVEEFEFDRKCLLNPLSNLRFPFPKVINLLDYQVVEVSKGYELQYSSGRPVVGVNKLVLFPDSAWNGCVKDTMIFALYHEGKLGFVKYGDNNWTLVDDLDFDYDDIIVCEGKSYVVDRLGIVSWINSSMKLIQFSRPVGSFGDQKHLVESYGEFFVVDRFFERKRRYDQDLHRHRVCHRTVNFEVYKLDQEWGHWVMIRNLGGQVFILGKDCSFSVSATEFSGCKGNCIYFTEEEKLCVFYLENKKIDKIVDFKDQCHPFCPPPSWLS